MADTIEPEAQTADGRRAGAMLAKARAKAKLDLAEVSARTRIQQRHLAAIEAGNYDQLPSRTYAVGFSRTYARLLGLDERAVADQVRLDLQTGTPQGPLRPDRFEPGDPARVPSRRLAWLTVLAGAVLVIGAFTFYRTYFSPGLGPAPLTEPTRPAARPSPAPSAPAAAPVAAAGGAVVFTSLADGTWVRFYDGAGKRLYEGQMARGQSFAIPAEAAGPRIWTGRPHAFAITVGGQPVAALGDREVVMKDVPVDAAALLARAPASAAMAVPAAPPPAAGPAT